MGPCKPDLGEDATQNTGLGYATESMSLRPRLLAPVFTMAETASDPQKVVNRCRGTRVFRELKPYGDLRRKFTFFLLCHDHRDDDDDECDDDDDDDDDDQDDEDDDADEDDDGDDLAKGSM